MTEMKDFKSMVRDINDCARISTTLCHLAHNEHHMGRTLVISPFGSWPGQEKSENGDNLYQIDHRTI